VVEERLRRAVSHRHVDEDAGRRRLRASFTSPPNQQSYAFVTRARDPELVRSFADQPTDLGDRDQRIVEREEEVV
jgi:hypothetical protein